MKKYMLTTWIIVMLIIPCLVRAVTITDYTDGSAVASTDDLLWIVDDPGGTPTDRKITIANLFGLYLGTVTNGAICLGNASSQVECTSTSFSGTIGGFTASRAIEADGSGNLTSAGTATTGTGAPVKGTSPTIATPSVTMPTTVGSGAITVSTNSAYVICTGACQVTLPAATAGKQYCVRNAPGSATVITLVNRASQYYELTTHAAWGTANYKLVSGGVATDSICVVGYDATHYATMTYTGTWTDTAP